MNSLTKACFRCKQNFPTTKEFFYANAKSVDGLQQRCKACAERQKEPRIPRELNGLYRCSRCKEYIHPDFFTKRKGKPGDYCLDCKRIKSKEYAVKNGVSERKVSRYAEGEKECLQCDKFKSPSEFYQFKTGISSYCKDCCKKRCAQNQEYREGGKYFRSRAKLTSEEKKARRKEACDLWNQKRKKLAETIVPPNEKECPRCDRKLPSTFFKKRSYSLDGLSKHCSQCEYDATKDGELIRKSTRWWIYIHAAAQRRARATNQDCDITKEFLQELFEKQKGLCYWFGVSLVPTGEKRHPQKPSLDRLDCSKGYTKDNVVLACHAANMGRNVSTVDQFSAFVAELKRAMQQTNS